MCRPLFRVALLWALVAGVGERTVLACSCMVSGPACQAYWKTDAVFDATVVDIQPLTSDPDNPFLSDTLVRLEVRQSWKGAAVGTLEVTTSRGFGSCGYDFKKGHRYLVFGRRGPAGRLQVSRCSATQEYDGAGSAAQFLASLAADAKGGRVFGTALMSARTFGTDEARSESAVVTTVRVVGVGLEALAISKDGQYEFRGLAPGHYSVISAIPDGYTTWQPVREVDIPDARACAEENFVFSPAGSIGGRVVDREGRGLRGIPVEITSPDMRPTPYGYSSAQALSDSDGYFTIGALPPGRYVAGVNLRDLPSDFNPYARTFYPGGSRPETITLSLGQTVDLGTWRLPPPLEVVPLYGVITWRDGTAASGIYVFLQDVTGNPVERARGAGYAIADANGRFMLEVRRSRTYGFGARETGKPQSPWLRIEAPAVAIATTAPEPVRIVIDRPR